MKEYRKLLKEKALVEQRLKNFKTSKIKYLIARYLCVISLEKEWKIYSWLWLLLPNWRYYLRLNYDDNHPRFGRYSNHYWKPNRVDLFRKNGYKYKLRISGLK